MPGRASETDYCYGSVSQADVRQCQQRVEICRMAHGPGFVALNDSVRTENRSLTGHLRSLGHLRFHLQSRHSWRSFRSVQLCIILRYGLIRDQAPKTAPME
jgi:hypothetical protein